MTVTSAGIKKGAFELKYGKHGTQLLKGMPTLSFPIEIHDAPGGTRSFALFFEDRDAIPVARFSWIHWVAANLTEPDLEENASANPNGRFVQGVNSYASRLLGDGALTDVEAARYGGMAPPDKAHTYELHIYALDTRLDLKDGFFANELFKAIKGHVLAETVLAGSYPATR
ncbi:MAG: YbhB/YbcL family Raf kinase inhibitor-like protein [Chthoniobacteraceae bacterium]